ncbi:MAG: GFA family protein [Deltaproteobacteria bacterium]|nr:GFA family protein [Deltaproteobacteria bacterium]
MKLEGRCLCGAVTYAFEGSPMFVFHCHCRDCQRAGGSVVHYGLIVPEAGFTLQGELRPYTSKAESGRAITREFCPTCGSGVINRLEMAPGAVVIRGGTLDDPTVVAPTFELYARTKPAWLKTDERMRSFDAAANAPREELSWHN